MCRTKTELNEKVAEYRKLHAKIKKLNAQLDLIKDDIIDYVVKYGDCDESSPSKSIKVSGIDYQLLYLTICQEKLDKKQLKQDLGEEKYAEYVTPNIYNQLRVS